MAELDDKLLKNLDGTLKSMNETLSNLSERLKNLDTSWQSASKSANDFAQQIREISKAQSDIKMTNLSESLGIDTAKTKLSDLVKTIKKLKGDVESGTEGSVKWNSKSGNWKYTKGSKALSGEEQIARQQLLNNLQTIYNQLKKGEAQTTIEIANLNAKEKAAEQNALSKSIALYNQYAEKYKELGLIIRQETKKDGGLTDRGAALREEQKKVFALAQAEANGIREMRLQGVRLTQEEELRLELAHQQNLRKIRERIDKQGAERAGTKGAQERAIQEKQTRAAMREINRLLEARNIKEANLAKEGKADKYYELQRRKIEEINKKIEEQKRLLASYGKSGERALAQLGGGERQRDNVKSLIEESREYRKEQERLAKVRKEDAAWHEKQRANQAAVFAANGKAIEQQRQLADEIDRLTRKREGLVKSKNGSSTTYDSRNYPLVIQIEKKIEELRALQAQIERQFQGSMRAGMEAARSKITEREADELRRETAKEEKERAKEKRQKTAADKEAISNMRQQIKYKQRLTQLDNSKKLKGRWTREEAAEYAAINRELAKLIQRQKELNQISPGATRNARHLVQPNYFNVMSKEAERYRKELEKIKSSVSAILPVLQRLGSAFGVYFSVQGLVQFGKKLIETRGTFEMQFVAMKQIIGDVDTATKIWNQTMDQALQSPFKAMQLVDYTKKLAAYRVENEKLFDTTKRLADVSAGLGVDMGRLILAYGQVKTANFLRASEVRQFTEAGVNIYGELAKYFSEIENRAVSTSDVVERVTKRMVLFSDVEEIFKRMTDEGGTFFEMQRVQSDTVRGQIMKLHDAYDQMLNTIGESSQGKIRDFVDTLNNLVRNWRDVWAFLKTNLFTIGPFIALLPLYRAGVKANADVTMKWGEAIQWIGLHFKKLSVSMKGFSISTIAGTTALNLFTGAVKVAKVALRTLVPFLAIEGLILLATKMTEAKRAAKQLKKELDDIGASNYQNLQKEIDGFNDLYERLKLATKGSSEYLDIRDKIQSRYGEYLNNLEAEAITVDRLNKSYASVVSQMKEKSRAHIMEEGLDTIHRAYGDEYNKFVKSITGAVYNKYKISSEEAVNIAKKMYDIYSKNPKKEYEEENKLFFEAFKQYTGIDISNYGKTGADYGRNFQDAIIKRYEAQLELERKANAMTASTTDTHREYLDQLKLEEEHERKIQEIYDKTQIKEKRDYDLQLENIRYEEKKLELQAKYQKKSKAWLDEEKKKLRENYGEFLNSYNARVAEYISGRYGANWREPGNKDTKEAWTAYNYMIATDNRLSQGQSKWEESILGDKKLVEENIQRIKDQQKTQTAADDEAAAALEASLKQEEARLVLIKKQMELLGLHKKDKSKGGGSSNSIYGERIRLLQDMLSKYKELAREAYGYAKAEGKVKESFEDAWSKIMPAGYGGIDVPTSYLELSELLQRLRDFTPKLDKKGKLTAQFAELEKAIADSLVRVDIEVSVRQREDFARQMEDAFSSYELTLDLQKLNLPKGLAADLWGIEETDLQGLRDKISTLFQGFKNENGEVSEEMLKSYQNYLNKIDDLERKQQRERLKEYSKYLEYQYSERVKLEMEYVNKIARLEAETAIPEEQKESIRQGLSKEFTEASRKQDWEDFKGSEFYVQMMEDLEKQGTASLEVMREKLLEMRDNAENLSPRALKEVVNALEKIDDIEKNRTRPLKRLREAIDAMEGQDIGQVFDKLSADQKQLATYEEEERELERLVMLENERQKLAEQGVTLEEAKLRLTQANERLSMTQKAYDAFSSDGTDESEKQRAVLMEALNKAKMDAEIAAEIIRVLSGQTTIDEIKGKSQYSGMSLGDIKDRIKQIKEEKKQLQGVIGKENELVKANQDLNEAWDAYLESVKTWAQSVVGIFDGVMDSMDYFEDSTQYSISAWKELGDTSVSALSDLVSGIQAYQEANAKAEKNHAATGLLTANGLKLALVVLGVIIKIVQAIAKAHDNRIEKSIDNLKEHVEDLRRAYDRLEKSIEKAFDASSYMSTYNRQVENLNQQLADADAQIAAAQDIKDDDKRKEIEDAAKQEKEQILDQLDELEQRKNEVFGGIGEESYRSMTEGFVEAWKSAFLETGNGLEGLKDHFDEFLDEWFVKQATMQGVASYYQKVFDYINDIVKDGNVPTEQDIANAKLMADEAAEKSDELLRTYSSIFGLGDKGELSGLAAGIQGMSEEQAGILESYWNSVRSYTANIDMNVARIADILGAGGDSTNPMLQQITLVAANTRATQLLLESVTKGGHPQGGYGIKVFND